MLLFLIPVSPLPADPSIRNIDISEGLEYLIEESGPLTPSDVIRNDSDWNPVMRSPLFLGSTGRFVWVRFPVEPPGLTGGDRLLKIDWPFFDHIDFYVFSVLTGDLMQRETISPREPHGNEIDFHPFVFPLEDPDGKSLQIYLRLHSCAPFILPLSVWEESAFRHMALRRNILLGLFFGVLLVMFFYNTFIFIFTKDGSYMYYSVYVFSIIFYTLTMSGTGVAYLWGNYSRIIEYSYGVFSSIAFMLAALFIRRFLSLTIHGGWLLHLSNGAVIYWIIVILLIITTRWRWLQTAEDIGAVASCFIGLGIPIVRWRRGDLSARNLVIAWTILIVSTFYLMMGLTGIFAYSPWMLYIQNIGFVIEVILLSLALAERINRERMEKEAARELSFHLARQAAEAKEREMKAQAKTLAIERAAKQELSAKVEERTRDLRNALEALEAVNAELGVLSRTDGLTHLANRRRFDEVFASEFSRARRSRLPLSVILGDVDRFKNLNDTYGHQAGDTCLKMTAETFRAQVSRSEDLVARYGGEEFVAVLPGTTPEAAGIIAEKIRQAVEKLEYSHGDATISITISLGVSGWIPQRNDSARDMLEQVDKALYRAKENGRNRVEMG